MLTDLLAKNGSGADKLYVEDVFSTYLYTGNSSTQTITNGINLSGKGGLVWFKNRTTGGENHMLLDTVRGANYQLSSNSTNAQSYEASVNFNTSSSGFSINNGYSNYNFNGSSYASWTFRKAAKFFDVVTYTGNGSNRTISHALGSVPGMIIVKRTDSTADWQVYHRSLANTEYLVLNSTAAKATGTTRWNSATATDTTFSLGTDSTVNASGGSYVAYLFAHDTTADGIVQCGSFNSGSGSASVELGWEPQFLIIKRTSGSNDWWLIDNMRGMALSAGAYLQANTGNAEASYPIVYPNATGFTTNGGATSANNDWIYLAIRRGPMRTPTDATKVFSPVTTNAANSPQGGFPLDLWWLKARNGVESNIVMDRLRSPNVYLVSDTTSAEASNPANYYRIDNMTGGFSNGGSYSSYQHWLFRRAPSFFDVVCYTGTGSVRTVSHNLGVAPELMIFKQRSTGNYGWMVYAAALGATDLLTLNGSNAKVSYSTGLNSTAPTSSVFTVGTASDGNGNGSTYVAYLFASCPGVSKVGSYTGTGTTKQIDCGFTNGARFVLIKRTDSTGDWYVYDSARGIVAGNDPYLLLNSTAAEVTSTDYVDAYSAGFELSSTAPAALNANGGTYIYLAIA